MANYPTSDPSFTTKNTGDTVQATHVNAVQEEVAAIGSALRGTLQHALTVNAALSVTGSATFSSLVTAGAQPRCMVTSSAIQAFTADSWQTVTFESETYDVGGLHSTATNPSRITIPAGSSGLYFVGGAAPVNASTSNSVGARVFKNGSTAVLSGGYIHRASVGATPRAHGPVVLDGGDYIELQVYPAGSTSSLIGGSVRENFSEFWAVRMW